MPLMIHSVIKGKGVYEAVVSTLSSRYTLRAVPLFSKASMVQLNMLYYYCEGPWVEQEEHRSWKMVKKTLPLHGKPFKYKGTCTCISSQRLGVDSA